jgi:predicted nucleic acid-binding protein
VSRFRTQITPDDVIIGCPVVWHEVRRGLLAKGAHSQIVRFKRLFDTFIWDDYQREDWDMAAQLWVKRRAAGQPIGDADLLIGTFAVRRNAVLITANEKDFRALGLEIENWAS